MKMAKADKKDIDAAGDLLQILNTLSDGYFPFLGEPDDDTPTFFDPDDTQHLRHLHELLAGLLHRAPGFQGRIIAGMAYVIMYSENEIIDPDADTLELHPKHVRNAQDAERWQHFMSILDNMGDDSDPDAPGFPEKLHVALQGGSKAAIEAIDGYRTTAKGK